MRLLPLNTEVWTIFASWFATPPPPPKQAIFIAVGPPGNETLAAGVCVYNTDGIYCFIEHFAVNPAFNREQRDQAGTAVTKAMNAYLTVAAKIGVCGVSFASGEAELERLGWKRQAMNMMTFMPGIPLPAPGSPPVYPEQPMPRAGGSYASKPQEPAQRSEERRIREDPEQRTFAEEDDDLGDDDLVPVPARRQRKKVAKKKRRRSMA